MEALSIGATEEALTLATNFLGRRGTVGSSSRDRGVDSFIDSSFFRANPRFLQRRRVCVFIRTI
jgi:hypothetical protein